MSRRPVPAGTGRRLSRGARSATTTASPCSGRHPGGRLVTLPSAAVRAGEKRQVTLYEIVALVQHLSHDDREVVAVLTHLLRDGRLRRQSA